MDRNSVIGRADGDEDVSASGNALHETVSPCADKIVLSSAATTAGASARTTRNLNPPVLGYRG